MYQNAQENLKKTEKMSEKQFGYFKRSVSGEIIVFEKIKKIEFMYRLIL